MGVRSRVASGLSRAARAVWDDAPVGVEPVETVEAAKAFGSAEPQIMAEAARGPAGMDFDHAFAPGEPIGPYDGFRTQPRTRDFTTGYNIATRPRWNERVSFDTLKGLISAYDVARICIWHRIDSIRGLDWKLVAKDNYAGDVTDAIEIGKAALDKPDRVNYFETWLAKWLYDVLAYDAGALYRMRNRGGRCVGLMPVDGTTVAPLLDYWGNPPQDPAEAYVQYIQGIPWNWLTRADMIYEPYRPTTKTIYGEAPLETILLNANTDLRFQTYFLQRFTEGNIPEAFASAPETWQPDQIEQWQTYWDSFMYGDQARKSQMRWIPGGSQFAWSNEKDFTDNFSLFLMRKTCAAYHVVPTDLGFTENANLASGESQADVQHRVGDLPFLRYISRILTGFVQDDLGLPLRFTFDLGEEQDDRLAQAQADEIYVQNAVVSASELREMRFGLPEPEGQVVPRIFFTSRSGPVPLSALYAVAGPTDVETGAPDPGTPLPETAFSEIQGVLSNPPVLGMPLAEQEHGPSALPPMPPAQPMPPLAAPTPVTVEPTDPSERQMPGEPHHAHVHIEKDATAGITAETGITGYDLVRPGQDDDDETTAVAKAAELAAFRRYQRGRRKAGQWRDFEFMTVDPISAHRLNDGGRLVVRKALGEIAVAGLAVQADDTGRVLMLQRALDPTDPAAGMWEFPGGHIEGDETPLAGAWREWAEETGQIPPPGQQTGQWTSPNGIYQGIVWTVPSEDSVPVRTETLISNPDDPDGDQVEAIAWWDPQLLAGNPAVRAELADALPLVLEALGESVSVGKHARVAKAVVAGPKSWPGWTVDLQTAAYWAPRIASAARLHRAELNRLAAAWLASSAPSKQQQGKRDRNAAAAAWLVGQGVSFPFAGLATGILADGYLIGALAARALVSGTDMQLGGWQPGHTSTAEQQATALGAGPALTSLVGSAGQAADVMGRAYAGALARTLTNGQDAGQTAVQIGAVLATVLDDHQFAAQVAVTTITQASSTAALDCYQTSQVAECLWLDAGDAKVCPLCFGNADQGPVPTGQPFLSGDLAPPAHPFCRCALVPA